MDTTLPYPYLIFQMIFLLPEKPAFVHVNIHYNKYHLNQFILTNLGDFLELKRY